MIITWLDLISNRKRGPKRKLEILKNVNSGYSEKDTQFCPFWSPQVWLTKGQNWWWAEFIFFKIPTKTFVPKMKGDGCKCSDILASVRILSIYPTDWRLMIQLTVRRRHSRFREWWESGLISTRTQPEPELYQWKHSLQLVASLMFGLPVSNEANVKRGSEAEAQLLFWCLCSESRLQGLNLGPQTHQRTQHSGRRTVLTS